MNPIRNWVPGLFNIPNKCVFVMSISFDNIFGICFASSGRPEWLVSFSHIVLKICTATDPIQTWVPGLFNIPNKGVFVLSISFDNILGIF